MYLTSLIVNERETRQGFPKDVLEDLLMLHSINDILMRTQNKRTATNHHPLRGQSSRGR